MSAEIGVSRVNFVLTILGWMWLIGCLIQMLVIDASLLFGGGLSNATSSWEAVLLLLPSLKWTGIGIAGVVVARTLIWILEGFVDE